MHKTTFFFFEEQNESKIWEFKDCDAVSSVKSFTVITLYPPNPVASLGLSVHVCIVVHGEVHYPLTTFLKLLFIWCLIYYSLPNCIFTPCEISLPFHNGFCKCSVLGRKRNSFMVTILFHNGTKMSTVSL